MPWTIILSYALLTCSVLSATIGYILWSRKHTNRYPNRLLALLLLVYAYINFVISLIINGAILDVPHFFRTAAPLNYLIGPLIYLYVRASLFANNRFDYRYGWLFLPALLSFIDLAPFYVQGAAYKVKHLQALMAAPNSVVNITEGWLPAWVYLIGSTLLNLVCTLLAGRLLWTYRRQTKRSYYNNSVYENWITTFVLIEVVAQLVWTIGMPFSQGTAYANYSLIVTCVLAELIICFYVIQRPMLLYGAYWLEKNSADAPVPSAPTTDAPATNEATSSVVTEAQAEERNSLDRDEPNDSIIGTENLMLEDESDIQEKLEILEQYMTNQQPYLQPRLSLANVSVAIDIPPYMLSAMLNRVVGLDFRDYVNAHRVRYLCDLLQSNQYNHLTLEGIGMEAGFSSKTTFYRAFQKHTGLTPAQYSTLNSQPDNQ